MFGKPCFWTFSELLEPKTGNYFQTFFQTFFVKFSRVWKNRLFPKKFRTSKNELFRNSRKQKVQKFQLAQGLNAYDVDLIFLFHLKVLWRNWTISIDKIENEIIEHQKRYYRKTKWELTDRLMRHLTCCYYQRNTFPVFTT